MKIIIDHIPHNTAYSRRPGFKRKPKSITIHSTGNKTSTALGERKWLTNPTNKRQASYHYAVDATNIVEVLPPDENAWHAGDGRGQGNMYSIGIEICESGNRAKAIANAVLLVKHLQKKFGLGGVPLKRHYDWSRKICPGIFYDGGRWTGWYGFVNLCKAENVVTPVSKPSVSPSKDLGLIEVLVPELWTYGSKNWADKEITVKDGEVFTVIGEHTVDGHKMYQIKSGLYITANPKYVKYRAKAAPKPVVKKKEELVEVLASSLWTYGSKDWNDKKITVSKGEVFTVTGSYAVGGAKMYRLKSGLYVTANPKYVRYFNR